ncbi:hypothetical protein ACWF94_01890 [Streptomyces sp. NPDC055078]
MHVAPPSTTMVQDYVALAEIELCGDLIIAASATDGDRLSPDRIDEVLKVAAERAEMSRRQSGLVRRSESLRRE